MRFLKLSAICLTVSSLIGCGSGLPDFPAEFVYVVKPDILVCSKHQIIKKDPVTIDNGEIIPWETCPHTFGFSKSDIAPVMDWVRNSQSEAKRRCK